MLRASSLTSKGENRGSAQHSIIIVTWGPPFEKSGVVHENQRVSEMANEVLSRQAAFRAERTGEPSQEALKAVLETKAGQYLNELRSGTHCDELAEQWQNGLAQKRAGERARSQQEERKQAEREAV